MCRTTEGIEAVGLGIGIEPQLRDIGYSRGFEPVRHIALKIELPVPFPAGNEEDAIGRGRRLDHLGPIRQELLLAAVQRLAGVRPHAHVASVRLEHSGPLTWIVLDCPNKANALSSELLDEFSDALQWLKDEGGVVIAIRGAGRGFSSGYDLQEVGKSGKAADPIADRERLQRNLDRYLAIWDHPKPVIAAIHGYCMAGATQIGVYSDITIVADDARGE